MRIFKDHEAIRLVAQSPGRFIPYVGAGVSAEAGVKTADAISEDIRERLTAGIPDADATELLRERLDWDNPTTRYSKCVQSYGNQSHRIQYFRRELTGKIPSYAHYAVATLSANRVLQRTIITTNFDKLLESAFVRLGNLECQAIRTDEEQEFIALEPDKMYVLKLHGDYDTYNIRNTVSELLFIRESLEKRVLSIALASGMIVLGASGFEDSIQRLFASLSRAMASDNQTLSFGLLWGVYMGRDRPKSLADETVIAAVRNAVSPKLVDIVEEADRHNGLCGFFPIWGAGEFLYRLVESTCSPTARLKASVYLSHEMRLMRVFEKGGLTNEGIERHLATLERARSKLARVENPSRNSEFVHTISRGNLTIDLYYGDISDRDLLATGEGVSAVVSPDDTMISAGGGVALALLQAAGPEFILYEIAKHQPIGHGEVAITSAGELPVHYLVHAAALRVAENGDHIVSSNDVTTTVRSAFRGISGLNVRRLYLPLIASGGASLVSPAESLTAIAAALSEYCGDPLKVCVIVYSEAMLDRRSALEILDRIVGTQSNVSSEGTAASAGILDT